jgi:hypothetical protein
MTEPQLDAIFSFAFTEAERKFLYANGEFQAAMAQVSEDRIEKLLQLGVRRLLTGGYVPPEPPQDTELQQAC